MYLKKLSGSDIVKKSADELSEALRKKALQDELAERLETERERNRREFIDERNPRDPIGLPKIGRRKTDRK